MSGKGNDGGHWVTINGSHVFIEGSSGEDNGSNSGGKVLKGKVEKTGTASPNSDGRSKGDKVPNSSEGSRGGSGGNEPDKGSSIWKSVGNTLITVASVASAILGAMAAGTSQSSGSYSGSGSSHKIPQYKAQIDNVVKQVKTDLSREYDNIQRLMEEVDAMPKGQERDAKWKKVLAMGTELDKAKSVVDRIGAFNTHNMPEKIVEEVNKLSGSLPQNYVKDLQSLGGGLEFPDLKELGQNIKNNVYETANNLVDSNSPENNRWFIDTATRPFSGLEGLPLVSNTANFHPAFPNSSDLWQYASHNIPIDNTVTFNSIDEIKNPALTSFLHQKVKEQLHTDDVKGLAFFSDSGLSKLLKNNNVLQNFIRNNKKALLNGKKLRNSINFNFSFNPDNIDAWGAIRSADIYESRIDQNGDFHAIIIDTYDFNPDPANPIVRMGRSAQDANLINNYFSVIFIYIDKNELTEILNSGK